MSVDDRRRRRRGIGAAALAAAMIAVDDVLFGEQSRDAIVEEADAPLPDPDEPVSVHLVPGSPEQSWARVRT